MKSAVSLEMSPNEIGNMTFREVSTLIELRNEHLKLKYEMQRNIAFNAYVNANRKKGSKMIPLFDDNDEQTLVDIAEAREELFGE